MTFVLESGSAVGRHMARHVRERNREAPTEEDKLHARWALLLDRLGISLTDEYEKLVADYLNAGLVDRSAVDAVVSRYLQEQQRANAQSRAHEFFQSTMWDPELTAAEIVEKAQELMDEVSYLDCYTVSTLHDEVLEVDGGAPVAEQMISTWVEELRQRAAVPGANPAHFRLQNWGNHQVHPLIVAAFAEAHSRLEEPRSLLDVSLHLAREDNWGHSEEAVMQAATVEDFMHTILSIRGEELKLFLHRNLDFLANRATYASHFGSAPEKFLEACKRIRRERAATRWASLIEDVFSYAKLDRCLNENPPSSLE